MSNFGADADPNITNALQLSWALGMTGEEVLQMDTYTIDENTQVIKLCDGTGKVNIAFKVDPDEL